VRARTNSLSIQHKADLVVGLKLTDVACVCIIPDHTWTEWLEYHYWPCSDSKRVLPAGIEARAEAIADGIEQLAQRWLIYCDSGRNRSNLLAALVVRRILACTGKEAIQYVRDGRPMALKNPLFISYLESL